MNYVDFSIEENNQKVTKQGTFKEWGLMPLRNNSGEIVSNESCAIVIDEETNKVYRVKPENVTFTDPFAPTLIN